MVDTNTGFSLSLFSVQFNTRARKGHRAQKQIVQPVDDRLSSRTDELAWSHR
jgi:hypothetical protein